MTASQRSAAPRSVSGLLVVGISEYVVSTDPSDILVTYSLGSCVGVSLVDVKAGVGGLIHCMLPLSQTNLQRAQDTPAMFVDTGMVAIMDEMLARGASKDRLVVKVAGGASPMDKAGRFKIGDRNFTVLRKFLWKNEILIAAQDVGGTAARTMRLYMDTASTTVKSVGEEVEL